MDYWKKREERSKQAKAHTKRMEELYTNNIDTSYEQSIVYGINASKPVIIISSNHPTTTLIQTDVVSVVFDLPKDKKIAVLNFASYCHPGGMFIEGSSAQEESLCHGSNLYNILSMFEDSFYKWNLANKHKALYRDRAIYTPNVVFERKTDNGYENMVADVLTCAAPNFGAAHKYQSVSRTENYIELSQRANFIKQILESNDVDIAVLGAWGTGVFKQDVKEVAALWKILFNTSTVEQIIHPIPDKVTYDKFDEVYRT